MCNSIRFACVSLLVGFSLVCCGGCVDDEEDRRDYQEIAPGVSVPVRTAPDLSVLLVFDPTGSFSDRADEALSTMLEVFDSHWKARLGQEQNDRVALAVIGSDSPIRISGTPDEIRRRFGSAKEFKNLIWRTRNTRGSNVHQTLDKAIRDILSYPANTNTKYLVLVFSDLEDTDSGSHQLQMEQTLGQLAVRNSAVGLYWVSDDDSWRSKLQQFGFRRFIVQGQDEAELRVPIVQ